MPSKRRQRAPRRRTATLSTSPLDDFFASYYPQFDYDPTKSASHEFYRLCDEFGWQRDDHAKLTAHENFKDALVKQFNEVYGTDEKDLKNWQNLCYIVQVRPVPDNMETCRKAVRGAFVNLVDLVDTDRNGEQVQVFNSELELSQYTKQTGKFFPKENAYAGGLLRYLLRKILQPATDGPSRKRQRTRR